MDQPGPGLDLAFSAEDQMSQDFRRPPSPLRSPF